MPINCIYHNYLIYFIWNYIIYSNNIVSWWYLIKISFICMFLSFSLMLLFLQIFVWKTHIYHINQMFTNPFWQLIIMEIAYFNWIFQLKQIYRFKHRLQILRNLFWILFFLLLLYKIFKLLFFQNKRYYNDTIIYLYLFFIFIFFNIRYDDTLFDFTHHTCKCYHCIYHIPNISYELLLLWYHIHNRSMQTCMLLRKDPRTLLKPFLLTIQLVLKSFFSKMQIFKCEITF